jgi:hypothetical protein
MMLADPNARDYTIPSGIDASGATDVTAGLNAFFGSIPDSSIIRFPTNARYRVEGTLVFVNRKSLTFDGNGATVFASTDGSGVAPAPTLENKWPRSRIHFYFKDGDNIVVRNLTVQGANPKAGVGDSAYVGALEAQHGFNFAGVRGGELDHVTVTDVYGDFVYFGSSSRGVSSGFYVHDSHFERNGRQGMSFVGADSITIERNYLGAVRRAHFDLEPGSVGDTIRRVTIRANQFGPGRLNFLSSGGTGGTVEDVTVQSNVLNGKALNIYVSPPAGSRRARFRIVDNVSDAVFGSGGSLMHFDRIDGLAVTGNRNPLQQYRNMTAVWVGESCGVTVSGNDFPNSIAEVAVVTPTCVP